MEKSEYHEIYKENTPQKFWQFKEEIADEIWHEAIIKCLQLHELHEFDLHGYLGWSLGEGSYNNESWKVPLAKQIYYHIKPLIPQSVSRRLRQSLISLAGDIRTRYPHWPVDQRHTNFLQHIALHVMEGMGVDQLNFRHFWKGGKRSAFVLTHDIEEDRGQEFSLEVADLEESYGFRSCFFFVLRRYPLNEKVIDTLRSKGFEIGVHGYNHDGKTFFNRRIAQSQMAVVNAWAKEHGAKTYRSPCTLRHPGHLQLLDMEGDLSFFDSDPFEPVPGGTMSIHPFFMGRLVELPYTLPQDYTIFELLEKRDTEMWLHKVDHLLKNHGLILLDTHPDYLLKKDNLKVYEEFLKKMTKINDVLWHALPLEVIRWWRARHEGHGEAPDVALATLKRSSNGGALIEVEP